MLQSLGRPELHMSLDVTIVSGSGQEHAGCLLLTSEVLFVVSLSEDTQQQAFPITEVTHRHKESDDISQRTTRGPFIDNDVNVKPLPPPGGVSAGTRTAGRAHTHVTAADSY